MIALLCCLAVPAQAAEPPARPNVLLIMADDLGVEGLGCYGGRSVATPNIDRMAEAGLRFTHAYAQPLCTNTRVELMTGRRATRDWIAFGLLNPNLRTFGHMFQDAGYRTMIIGKWQLASYDPPDYPGAAGRRGLGMRPSQAGFDTFSLYHAGETEEKGSRYADPTFTVKFGNDGDPEGRVVTFPGAYGPQLWANDLSRWLTDHAENHAEEPFFVYYPMALPHWPMQPTPDSPEWNDPTRRTDTHVRYLPDMVRYMDRNVGRVWDTLRRTGLDQNTLVLFYSDNGTHIDVSLLTEDGWRLGGKGLTTDAGTHVPLVAIGPGVGKGTTDVLVQPTDFLPTVLDWCGLDPADGVDGVSFAPALRGESGTREAVVIDFEPRPGWDKDRFTHLTFARDHRWKLYDDGRLYEMESDRFENRPVRNETDETRAARQRLRAALATQAGAIGTDAVE